MTHPTRRIDDDVHQRVRLGILAVLAGVTRADFSYLKTHLETTDGNLGRHLETLQTAGYVTITKAIDGRRPRTWAKITPQGRAALHHEIDALKEIVALVEQPPTPQGAPLRLTPQPGTT
jgi:DNA-binding MarR family transcriptional regulator